MRAVAAGLAMLCCGASAQAQVALADAWLRPAYAGQPQAQVYVDIRSPQPLELVAASSPAARRAQLVLVDAPHADPATHRVVDAIAVPAGGMLRLALGGSHVRLVDVRRDLLPGERVPLELAFVDAEGRRTTATTEALVRGLVPRRPEPASN